MRNLSPFNWKFYTWDGPHPVIQLFFICVFICVFVVGGVWIYDLAAGNKKILGHIDNWGMVKAFDDEKLSPLSAYSKYIPEGAISPDKSSQEIWILVSDNLSKDGWSKDLQVRRKLMPAVWKCISESPQCKNELLAKNRFAFHVMIVTFLAEAAEAGSADALIDMGLLRVRGDLVGDMTLSAPQLAPKFWNKAMNVRPGDERAQRLLEKFNDSLWVSYVHPMLAVVDY